MIGYIGKLVIREKLSRAKKKGIKMGNCVDDFWNSIAVQQTRAGTGVSVKTKEYKEYENGERSLNSLEDPFIDKWGHKVAGYSREEYVKRNND